jgi:hypothetical protein
MELNLKFKQYAHKDWVRRNPETSCKKLLEHNGFIILRLRNNFLPWRVTATFGEISLLDHLSNTTHGDHRWAEVVTLGALIETTFGVTVRTCITHVN